MGGSVFVELTQAIHGIVELSPLFSGQVVGQRQTVRCAD
jgi:hypothetical protein